MGKIAENERIKLRAMFFNNIAVGAAITGFVVPFISIYASFAAVLDTPERLYIIQAVKPETFIGMVAAFL